MHLACWIPNATHSHSEYVIFIAFFTATIVTQGATILHYTYIACLVIIIIIRLV